MSQTETDTEPKSLAKVAKVSQLAITEKEFKRRVAAKAHELYVNRQALTEIDDWMRAERMVKEELLADTTLEGYRLKV